MGDWLLITLVSHLDHYMDPLPSYTSYMIVPNCLHLGIMCSRKIFPLQEVIYVLFFGGPALHGAVVVLGFYKLLVIPNGDIWSPALHKFGEVLPS